MVQSFSSASCARGDALEVISAVRDVSPATIHIDAKPLATDWGTDSLGNALRSGLGAEAIEQQWASALQAFMTLRAQYLLYS